MTFTEKLLACAQAHDSLLCVGLDPTVGSLPTHLGRDADAVARFGRAIVESTSDLVCAFKPNLAFYETLGTAGLDALSRTLEAIPRDIPVIGDAKRGDIGSSSAAYARALFDHFRFDAITVSPYLGHDSIEPFLDYAGRGVFVLCRTSNPGARDFQDLMVDGQPLYVHVARQALGWKRRGDLGFVVGATYPEEIARIRSLAPDVPLLVPGVGAQGGELGAAVQAAVDARGQLAVINSSRQVLYASSGTDFADAAVTVAAATRDQINSARRSG
jgi:orotidine-5'-phosphate decarboxylase